MAAHCCQEASRTVTELINSLNNATDDLEIDSILLKLDYLIRTLVNLGYSQLDEVIPLLGKAYDEIFAIRSTLDQSGSITSASGHAPKVHSSRPGRPSFDIKEERLSFLLNEGFKIPTIALLFKVSARTIERRLSKYGLSVSATYTNLSDEELDKLVREAQRHSPGIGLRMLMGYLRGKGLRFQWERVRQSLLRTDPSGVHQRWRESIRRRVYRVSGPLALWHIDGNHKLIRWRIVIHAGVDGYSRLPVYLCASSNNRAETVMNLFTEAVAKFGLPLRVRSDKGGENYDVGLYMLSHPQRGPGRGSIIAGKSTHNQRIERLWRDIYDGCISLFYQIFHYLENNLLLDMDNEVHIWCLHFVYLPMINHHLQIWQNSWIHHPLSTEKNKSPMQLWIAGLHFTHFGQRMLQDMQELLTQEEIDQYGIDWGGPVSPNEENVVEVPDTLCPLDDNKLTAFKQAFNITTDDGNYGITLYMDCVSEVTRLLEIEI